MTRRKSSCCCKKGEDCPDGSKKGSCCHPPFRRSGSDQIFDSYCVSGQCREKCDPKYFPNEFEGRSGQGPSQMVWTANNDCSTACLGSCCYGYRPTIYDPIEYFLCTDNVEIDDCGYLHSRDVFGNFTSWTLGQKCVGTNCGDNEKVGYCCTIPIDTRYEGEIRVTKKGECAGTWESFPASGLGLSDIIFSPYGGKYPAGFCGGAKCFYNELPPYNLKYCCDMWTKETCTDNGRTPSGSTAVFTPNVTCANSCTECECMYAILCTKSLVTYTNSQCPSAGLNSDYSENYTFAAVTPVASSINSKAECGEGRTARNLTAFQAFSNLYTYSSDVYYGDYHVVQSRTVTPVVINSSYARVQLPQNYSEIHTRGNGTDCNYRLDTIGNGPIVFGYSRCVLP